MTAIDPAGSWRPAANPDALALRARLRARLRLFFEARGVLEVDTPALSAAAPTEPNIALLTTRALGREVFLQSSPEFPMKRLLAAGVGDCWQLARVFRDGERGRWHQPEFDLVEWYRIDHDHHELMDEIEALLAAVLEPEQPVLPAERLSYTVAFERHVGIDPISASVQELQAVAANRGIGGVPGLGDEDRTGWLDHLLTGLVIPALSRERPTFIHDWPAEQAALARLSADTAGVASRFELYWGDVELANGFHELCDAREQRARFERENRNRIPPLPVDEHLLAALEAGLPDCAGVALGFDRLVMLAAGAETIDEVVAFPFERA